MLTLFVVLAKQRPGAPRHRPRGENPAQANETNAIICTDWASRKESYTPKHSGAWPRERWDDQKEKRQNKEEKATNTTTTPEGIYCSTWTSRALRTSCEVGGSTFETGALAACRIWAPQGRPTQAAPSRSVGVERIRKLFIRRRLYRYRSWAGWCGVYQARHSGTPTESSWGPGTNVLSTGPSWSGRQYSWGASQRTQGRGLGRQRSVLWAAGFGPWTLGPYYWSRAP